MHALGPRGGGTNLLHRWDQKTHQDGDDSQDHEELDQRKAGCPIDSPHHRRLLYRRNTVVRTAGRFAVVADTVVGGPAIGDTMSEIALWRAE